MAGELELPVGVVVGIDDGRRRTGCAHDNAVLIEGERELAPGRGDPPAIRIGEATAHVPEPSLGVSDQGDVGILDGLRVQRIEGDLDQLIGGSSLASPLDSS